MLLVKPEPKLGCVPLPIKDKKVKGNNQKPKDARPALNKSKIALKTSHNTNTQKYLEVKRRKKSAN